MDKYKKWERTCLRKTKLEEGWADDIVKRAEKEGNYLRKYYCPHCFWFHVTKKKR